MRPSEVDDRVLAYFLLNHALSVNIDGRFRRREEFIQTFEDAVFYSTQKYAEPFGGRHPELCASFLQQLIDSNCLAASHDKRSGTSYQFDATRYRAFIKERVDANAVCQEALKRGPGYWDEMFKPV